MNNREKRSAENADQRTETSESGVHLIGAQSAMDEFDLSARVRDVMRPRPLCVEPTTNITTLCQLLERAQASEALIVEGSDSRVTPRNLLGIITRSDVIRVLAGFRRPGDVSVQQAMSFPVCTLAGDLSISSASQTLRDHGIRRAPVLLGGAIAGLLTRQELLSNSRLRLQRLTEVAEEFETAAFLDSLTGLANRRQLLRRVDEAKERGGDEKWAFIAIDIDHFKRINDDYGHPFGDAVLVELSARLLRSVRSSDLVARVGGEEFAVLAEVQSETAVHQVAEKLRASVARAPFPQTNDDEEKNGVSVTISVGTTLFDPGSDPLAEAVARADRALYRAKDEGRNQVFFA